MGIAHRMTDESAIRTTNAQRWLYSLGNLGCAIPYQALGAVLLFFYTDVKRLPPLWAAAVLTGYSVYNAVNNPVMGYLSDRTRSPWGRRVPYILLGSLPYALAFAALFLAPFDGVERPKALLAYFVAAIFLFETLATLVQTAYYSLLPEMFADYGERTAVAVRMNVFMTVGLLAGAALPGLLASKLGWAAMGLLLAALSFIALLASLRGMVERRASAEAAPLPLGPAIKATFSNRSFVTVVVAQTMRHFATATLSSGMAFYAKYSLGADPGSASLVLGTAFVVAGLALWPWRRFVANRFEARTTMMLAYALTAVAVVPLAFVRSLGGAMLAAAFVGVALAGLILMGDVVLSDVIDEDETKTGQRREGMYFGMSGLIITLAYALSAQAFAFFSAAFGYDPSLASQSAGVGEGFRLFMSLPPCVGSLLALAALYFYPLHGERLGALRAAQCAKARAAGAIASPAILE